MHSQSLAVSDDALMMSNNLKLTQQRPWAMVSSERVKYQVSILPNIFRETNWRWKYLARTSSESIQKYFDQTNLFILLLLDKVEVAKKPVIAHFIGFRSRQNFNEK